MERFFNAKPIYEHIQFLCGLSALCLSKAKAETRDKGARADLLSAAGKHLSAAKILDDQEQLVYLGLGLLALAKVREGGREGGRREDAGEGGQEGEGLGGFDDRCFRIRRMGAAGEGKAAT